MVFYLNVYELDVSKLSDGIKNGDFSAEEVVTIYFDRNKKIEDKVHAFISQTHDLAIEQARKLDENIKNGEKVGKLAGVPIGVKDNINVIGTKTTCGSKMLENYESVYNAHVIDKILKEDAIIIGKCNMDEFAMGTSCETSYFGPTYNPWNHNKVPGGSSGGSAASVSTKECSIAFGSDTGGSIRCPASFCGVVGLKPTYGHVSRYGLVAYASSLDQIGPISRTVKDNALFLETFVGHDNKDSTSVNKPSQNYVDACTTDIRKIKVGVAKEFFSEGLDPTIKNAILDSIAKLEELGAICTDISLPHLSYALPTYYLIATSEASSNLARFDGVRYGHNCELDGDWSDIFSVNRKEGFGTEVIRRILLGTFALSAGYYDQYYLKAQKIRTLIKNDFLRAFKTCDVIGTPTTPILPFDIGEKINDPLSLYMADLYTVPVNLAGLPSIALPCSFKNDLPIGLQLIGSFFSESKLYNVSYALEKELNLQLDPKVS